MKNIILILLLCIATQVAWAGTGAIPSGPNIKLLKDNLRFKNTNTRILTNDSDDPQSVAKDSEVGSLYIRSTTGAMYQKQDSGSSTNWSPLLIGSAGTGTDDCVARWDGTGSTSLQDALLCVDDVGVATGLTQLLLDNLDINGNTISSTDANGPINLAPNGTGVVNISGPTASRPMKLDASNNVTSALIDLADSTNDITGVLPIANGGNNSASALTSDLAMRSDGTSIIESSVTLNATGDIGAVTSLQVDNVNINGNTITSTGDLTLTPATATDDVIIPIQILGSPTIADTKTYHDNIGSVGVFTDYTITDNGDGTVSVPTMQGMIRATNSDSAELISISAPISATLALTDLVDNYIYVEYNSGTPQIVADTTQRTDHNTNISVAKIYRSGTVAHINELEHTHLGASVHHLADRFFAVDPYARETGGVVSATGTRNFAITAGTFWHGMESFNTTASDTSATEDFRYYYRDGIGGWTQQTAQTQIHNTLYDDGSGTLATLSNNKYAVHWLYLELDSDLVVLYGRGDYTLLNAQRAQPPSDVPPEVETHGFIMGKVIIQKSASVFEEIDSAFDLVFTGTGVVPHNDLASLQGGASTEYYHLDLTEFNFLDGQDQGVRTTDGPTFSSTTVSTLTDTGVVIAGTAGLLQTDHNGLSFITGTNRLGVNSVTPTDTLDVNGTVNFSDTLTLSALTAKSVLFAGTGGLVSEDTTNFVWDDTANRLGIGLNNPSKTLEVTGDALISSKLTLSGELEGQYVYMNSTSTFSIPYPRMTTAQVAAAPNINGGTAYDTDLSRLTINNGTIDRPVAFLTDAGDKLNLIVDPSFEDGVTEGTCTTCTATQETTIALLTGKNAGALKMAFSAGLGDYTDTTTTSSEFSNVSAKTSAWIKTSAEDCHFVEMVDGAESQTVEIASNDEWKQYVIDGTTGTTSYGYRVECNTSITDNVYVDEVYSGPIIEPIINIAQASHLGSVRHTGNTNCSMSLPSASTAWQNFTDDLDCDDIVREKTGANNITDISIGATHGRNAMMKISYIPAGTVKVTYAGAFYDDNASQVCNFRISDGGVNSATTTVYAATAGVRMPIIIGEFHYDTPQYDRIYQLQANNNNAGNCWIEANVAGNKMLEISASHFPAPQQVFASKCEGLECENTLTAFIPPAGVVPTTENVSGWIASIAQPATGRTTVTFATDTFSNTPSCQCSTDHGNYSCSVVSITATSLEIQRMSDGGALGGVNAFLSCGKQGSDYNQFDQRFIPVMDNGPEMVTYTGFTSRSSTKVKYKTVKEDTSSVLISHDNTGTETIFTALQDTYVILSQNYDSVGIANNQIILKDAGGTTIKQSYEDQTGTEGYYGNGNTLTAYMKTGDYAVAYLQADVYDSVATNYTITAFPVAPKALIGNLNPKEFVKTIGATKPIIHSCTVGMTSGTPTHATDTCALWIDSYTDTAVGDVTINTTKFGAIPTCTVSIANQSGSEKGINKVNPSSATAMRYRVWNDATPALADYDFDIICHGTSP